MLKNASDRITRQEKNYEYHPTMEYHIYDYIDSSLLLTIEYFLDLFISASSYYIIVLLLSNLFFLLVSEYFTRDLFNFVSSS